MGLERVGLFVDLSNIYYSVQSEFNGRKVAFDKFYARVSKLGTIFRAYAYGAQINNQADEFLKKLRQYGYQTKYKMPTEYRNRDANIDTLEEILRLARSNKFDEMLTNKLGAVIEEMRRKVTRKADWDVGLAMDIVRIIDKIDIVVLASADGDIAPALKWAKEKGCRTVVIACKVSRELREVADEHYEIDESLLELERKNYGIPVTSTRTG